MQLLGTVTLAGNSLLEFGTGSIATIAAGGALTIANATAFVADASDLTHNSALAGLQSIAGALTLQGGTGVTTAGPLSVSGSLALPGLDLDHGRGGDGRGNGVAVNLDATSTLAVTGGTASPSRPERPLPSGALTAALIDVAGGKFDYVKSIIDQAFELGDDGLLEFGNSVDATSTVTFTDGTGTVQLDLPGSFAATIAGAQVGDVFHLIGTPVTALSYANNTLTVSGSGGTVASLNFTGTYNTSDFGFQSDGLGGAYITVVQGPPATASVWTNAAGGNWTTAASWGSGVPTSATDALIGVPGTYTVKLTSSGAAANSLTIDDANATFELDSGASLAVGHDVNNAGTVSFLGTSSGAAMSVSGNFINTGTLNVDSFSLFFNTGGSTLNISGTLSNSGTIAIGNIPFGGSLAPVTVTAQSLVNTGTIVVNGPAQAGANGKGTLNITGGAAPSILTGKIEVNGNALLEFASGGITSIAASGTLIVNGANAFVAIAGSIASNSALTGLSSNAGNVEFDNGSTTTVTPAGNTFANSGTFQLIGNNSSEGVTTGPKTGAAVTIASSFLNTGTLDVDTYWFFGNSGGSTLTIQGTLTNSGTLGIGNAPFGGSTAPVTVNAQSLANTGSISIVGHTGAIGTLNVSGAASGALGGTINLSGLSLIEFASGSFSSIAAGASLNLNGPQAFIADSNNLNANGALSGLTANAGTLTLFNSALSLSGGLSNTGTLNFDSSNAGGGSVVSIAGTLTDTGTLRIGNSGLATATTVTIGGLNEQGTLTLTGSANARAILNVTGAAQSTISSAITLTRNALLEFGSGSITNIAAGGSLTLDGGAAIVADSNNVNSNGALSGLASLAGTFSLLNAAAVSTTGNLANTGSLQVDASNASIGASSLSIGGTLDNANQIIVCRPPGCQQKSRRGRTARRWRSLMRAAVIIALTFMGLSGFYTYYNRAQQSELETRRQAAAATYRTRYSSSSRALMKHPSLILPRRYGSSQPTRASPPRS